MLLPLSKSLKKLLSTPTLLSENSFRLRQKFPAGNGPTEQTKWLMAIRKQLTDI